MQAATDFLEKRMNIIELNTTPEFTELATNHEWVLVDFFASWCAPCSRMAPVFEHIVEKHQSALVAAKVNVDHLPRFAEAHQVRSIPTFILFRHGQVVDQLAGTHSAVAMDQWLSSQFSHQNLPAKEK